MYNLQVRDKSQVIVFVSLFLLVSVGHDVQAWNTEYEVHEGYSFSGSDVITLDSHRYKRDVQQPTPPAPAPGNASAAPPPATEKPVSQNQTDTESSTPSVAVVTKVPLLNVNGAVIRVSDPIVPDDNITELIKDSNVAMDGHHNLTSKNDTHVFYNSSFIDDKAIFDDYWNNITAPKADVHPILSNSYRRASTIKLKFDFPFYGHPLHNITVATGGFIYTGEHVHNWLAATQYIAPLMANFDTAGSNDSVVKFIEDDDKFSAVWENVTLQEDAEKKDKFSFAATLFRNGDIVFAYKDVPLPVTDIKETEHPVKVGISDAYQTDKVIFYVRRKTIYEYHRVSLKSHPIANHTLLRLVALPTCLQYSACDTCVNHDTAFNCSWCEQLQKCSSGTDRNKQDWLLRNCDKSMITSASSCPASPKTNMTSTVYTTELGKKTDDTVIKTVISPKSADVSPAPTTEPPANEPMANGLGHAYVSAGHPMAGVVATFVVVALISSLAAWVLYAFKNPHTRSGQLLIRYRPSQWSWRRGEARYTAATIHM